MKQKAIGTVTTIIVIIIIAGISAGAGYYTGQSGDNRKIGPDTLQGNLSMSGSTTVRPLAKEMRNHFTEIYPKVKITIQGGGSGQGIADAKSGEVNIGMSSTEKLIKKENQLVGHRIAYDGIMVIVNKNNPILDTLEEKGIKQSTLKKIYNGTITNWSQISGIDYNASLTSYTRAEESGTAETLASFLETTQDELDGPGQTGNNGVKSAVGGNKNSIGYIGAAYAFSGNVEEIPVDGNNDNKVQGYEKVDSYDDLLGDVSNYPIKRSLWLVTKKGHISALAHSWINWCRTEGQEYVSDTGYIPISGA